MAIQNTAIYRYISDTPVPYRGLNKLPMVWYSIKYGMYVMFHTTDPTPSLSPLKTLCRCIVDHQTLPVVRSLFLSRQFPSWPESSGTLPYAKSPLPYPWHLTCQRTPFNTCILTQDLRLQSHMEQIPYVQSSLSYVCLIIPHATFYYSTCHL